MAHTTSGFEVWKPEIEAYMEDEKNQMPDYNYSKLFNVRGVDRLEIPEKTWSGFGIMEQVGQMEDAVEDETLDGYKTVYSPVNYRKSATFSKKLLKTDQTGQVENMARSLQRVPEYTREVFGMGVFRNSWNSGYTYGDGQRLISLSHPLKDGSGTVSNTFPSGTQKPLTYDNALELEDQLNAVVSNSGNLMSIGNENANKVLVVPDTLREVAFQIAGVEGPDGAPDSAENNKNYFRKGAKYDVMVTKFLNWDTAYRIAGETTVSRTSASNYWDSMWFIVDKDACKQYFKMYHTEGYPYFDDEITKANEAMVKYAYDDFAFGVTAYYPIVGSKGDNSSYSG